VKKKKIVAAERKVVKKGKAGVKKLASKGKTIAKKVVNKVKKVVKKVVKKTKAVAKAGWRKTAEKALAVEKKVAAVAKSVRRGMKLAASAAKVVAAEAKFFATVVDKKWGSVLKRMAKIAGKVGSDLSSASKKFGAVAEKLNVVATGVEAGVECHGCSAQCRVCHVSVATMTSVGEDYICDYLVPAGCEALGVGPEDPLADACAVAAGAACNQIMNSVNKGIKKSAIGYEQLCKTIRVCNKNGK